MAQCIVQLQPLLLWVVRPVQALLLTLYYPRYVESPTIADFFGDFLENTLAEPRLHQRNRDFFILIPNLVGVYPHLFVLLNERSASRS
jgi:hypothetical protein